MDAGVPCTVLWAAIFDQVLNLHNINKT
jgi:hypothetical protein